MKEAKEILLESWEDVYKKSQLTFWILLSLKAGEKSMAEIKEFIKIRTKDTIEADDKSMYRALRRFNEADLIAGQSVKNQAGPDIKIWHLTTTGQWVLKEFIKRQFTNILFDSDNQKIILE